MALKIPAVQTALDNINAWKTATEAMYAQGEQGQGEAKPEVAQGDDVQDVDYEEVNKQITDFLKIVNPYQFYQDIK
jgi:hypothetical protein